MQCWAVVSLGKPTWKTWPLKGGRAFQAKGQSEQRDRGGTKHWGDRRLLVLIFDKLTTSTKQQTPQCRAAGSYTSQLQFSGIDYNKLREKKILPLLRVALGQRGAFTKDALDFSCVPQKALPPVWPRISTQGRKYAVSLNAAKGREKSHLGCSPWKP